jgi:hypothetical protein
VHRPAHYSHGDLRPETRSTPSCGPQLVFRHHLAPSFREMEFVYCYLYRSDPTQFYNTELLLRDAVMTVMTMKMGMMMMTHENLQILYEIKLPTAEDTKC